MVEFQKRTSRIGLKQLGRILVLPLVASLLASSIAPHLALADTLYDGYSKILLDGQHVGYVALKYDFDVKKKEFTASYYLKTDKRAGNLTESLRARASETLRPISFQYTQLAGDKTKLIDGTVKGDTLIANVKDDGKPQVIQKKIPKGAFLAIFLVYIMLQGKDGMKKGTKYNYQAIAEEDAGLYSGEAYIAGEETVLGINAFKVLNTFKGSQFVSYYTYDGATVATRSPAQKTATDLVATPSEATAGQVINKKDMDLVFGSMPRGLDNPLSKRASGAADAKPEQAKTVTPAASSPPEPHGK